MNMVFLLFGGAQNPNQFEIFFSRLDDGINFSNPINISNNEGPSLVPDIDIS